MLDEKMVSVRDSVEWDLELDYFLQCTIKEIIIKLYKQFKHELKRYASN